MIRKTAKTALRASLLMAALLPSAVGHATALPKDMTGIWAFDPASCDDENSDARLNVAPLRVDSYGSAFKLRDIRQRPDGSWGAKALRSDEGEPKRVRDTLVLKLVSPDRLTIRSGRDVALDYFRCKIARRST